jgi:integrase
MPVIKLSQHMINNELRCPAGKPRVELCDADLAGLYIEVRATSPGHGSYYLRYKDNTGKTSHQKIGRTSEMSLADARKQAKILKAEIALGADPKAKSQASKTVPTYGEFFEQQYLPYVQPRKRSWSKDEEMFRLRLKAVFGDMRLTEITRQEIQAFHTQVKQSGLAASSCNHYVKLLKHSLNLAIDWNMLDTNPAVRIPLFHEDNKKENYLSEEELERLLQVLRTDDNRAVCQILLFLLSTGARLNEALVASWENIDMDRRVWRILASNSKSKRIRSVPLNDSALEVLKAVNTQGQFEHVFINQQTGEPYTTISKVWGRIRQKARLPQLRIHDLRHGFASFLVNNGRTLYEVQALLGHSSPNVTQRYAHLSTKALQDAADSASIAIREASR